MNLDIKLTNYSLTILNLLNRDRNHSYFGVTGVSCNFFFKLLMAQHYISSINASFRLHDALGMDIDFCFLFSMSLTNHSPSTFTMRESSKEASQL